MTPDRTHPDRPTCPRILVVDSETSSLGAALAASLDRSGRSPSVGLAGEGGSVDSALRDGGWDVLVYAAAHGLRGPWRCRGPRPAVAAARAAGVRQVVVLSSAAVNEPNWRNPGRLSEEAAENPDLDPALRAVVEAWPTREKWLAP